MTRLVVLAAFILAFLTSAPGVAQQAKPDPRPMVKLVDIRAKGIDQPLYCLFMRPDGSQFATDVVLSMKPGAKDKDGSTSLGIVSSSIDLPNGKFPGVTGGIPLMDSAFFDLPADPRIEGERRRLRLDFITPVADGGKEIGSFFYRAELTRSFEDFSDPLALGFCHLKAAIEITPRISKR